jgi:hypothetical protein
MSQALVVRKAEHTSIPFMRYPRDESLAGGAQARRWPPTVCALCSRRKGTSLHVTC